MNLPHDKINTGAGRLEDSLREARACNLVLSYSIGVLKSTDGIYGILCKSWFQHGGFKCCCQKLVVPLPLSLLAS